MLKRFLPALLGVGFAFTVQAQSQLAQLVSEADVGWMIGNWTGQTENGQQIRLSFKWVLDQYGILTTVETPDWEAGGLSVVDPASGDPVYHGADNHGVVADGRWTGENGTATLLYHSQSPSGKSDRIGIVYSHSTDGTMKLSLHRLDSYGELQYPAQATLTLRKQK